MKTERNILIAFILNLLFSVFECVGGLLIGSVAILSDALHDLGDAMSIGVAYFLERKSKRPPDDSHSYGYARYSVLGGLITSVILLVGSCLVVYNAIHRILSPTPINYDGMIVFAIVGAIVNLAAAMLTRDGDSINQKAVNLHMLEDVLGWVVVLIGAVVMRFTDFWIIDPLLSIGVAVFIFLNALKHLKEVADLFLERTPTGISIPELKEHLCQLDGVIDAHHIHVWSVDGIHHSATLHVRTDSEPHSTKEAVREELREHGIVHATIETETADEPCHDEVCTPVFESGHCHHHHHHH